MGGDAHEVGRLPDPERARIGQARSRTSSRTRPGLVASTSTCWERNTASGIEWVTKRMVVDVSCQIRSSSSLRLSRVISSSAPKGSSISNRRGSVTSARAIATRWRIPPDSSWGSAASRPPSPTSRSRASGVRRAVAVPRRGPPRTAAGHSPARSATAGAWGPGRRSRAGGRSAPPPGSRPGRSRAPPSGTRGRRPVGAAWTCRTPRARAGSRSRRPGCRWTPSRGP